MGTAVTVGSGVRNHSFPASCRPRPRGGMSLPALEDDVRPQQQFLSIVTVLVRRRLQVGKSLRVPRIAPASKPRRDSSRRPRIVVPSAASPHYRTVTGRIPDGCWQARGILERGKRPGEREIQKKRRSNEALPRATRQGRVQSIFRPTRQPADPGAPYPRV